VSVELIEQLKPGGRMVIPVGEKYDQNLLLITKDESGQVNRAVIDKVIFVELVGKYGWQGDKT